LELYKRWGWSKDMALSAFKRHPNCMLLSEEKITKAMDFFVNKMGWPSANISLNPSVLFFSLEKRIMPRFLVIQILLLGYVKRKRRHVILSYVAYLTHIII
jgi:mTERF domain-containing protein